MALISRVFIIAAGVSYFAHLLFFFYSPVIWSSNPLPPINSFMPILREDLLERDGVETYVLYGGSFLAILAAFGVDLLFEKFKGPFVRVGSYVLGTIVVVLYLRKVGVHLPIADPRMDVWGGVTTALIITISGLFWFFYSRSRYIKILLFVLLFLICMIPFQWAYFSWDYNYYFNSALRILHGFSPKETYFQYDYLFSFLNAVWFKLGLPAKSYHLFGLFSFFVLFSGIFLLARQWFFDKRFAILLLAMLLVVRLYGGLLPVEQCLQGTPLRLDAWFPLLVLFFWKGFRHCSLGLFLGFLVLFSHSFGMIYVVSYLILLAVLMLVDLHGRRLSYKEIFLKHCPLANLIFIGTAVFLYQLFFMPSGIDSANAYLKYGIGFLPISSHSFYWHVLMLLLVFFLLLCQLRSTLSERYFQSSIFLIILFIGNSLYFFGRSHEANIISISTGLLLILFLVIDLVHRQLVTQGLMIRQLLVPVVAFFLLGGATYVYSGKIVNRGTLQLSNIVKNPFTEDYSFDINVPLLKAITKGSSRVIFLTTDDFPYYYEGKYVPQGFHCFTGSWFFVKDYVNDLNARLSEGYYLIFPLKGNTGGLFLIAKDLQAKKKVAFGNYVVITNNE